MTLDDVKKTLRVSGNDDDALLTRLLNAAKAECRNFTNLETLDGIADADLWQGVMLMIHADYDGDPKDRNRYRRAAESLWMPYRTGLGV